jgi:hypothetical protein
MADNSADDCPCNFRWIRQSSTKASLVNLSVVEGLYMEKNRKALEKLNTDN